MSVTTPTQARTALAADLSSLIGAKVQPAINLQSLASVTGILVGLSSAGMSSTEFLVRISVYASAKNNAANAIANVESFMVQVDDLLRHAPRSDWECVYEVPLEAWHAATVVSVGREDF